MKLGVYNDVALAGFSIVGIDLPDRNNIYNRPILSCSQCNGGLVYRPIDK